jgi:hypothetical protein
MYSPLGGTPSDKARDEGLKLRAGSLDGVTSALSVFTTTPMSWNLQSIQVSDYDYLGSTPLINKPWFINPGWTLVALISVFLRFSASLEPMDHWFNQSLKHQLRPVAQGGQHAHTAVSQLGLNMSAVGLGMYCMLLELFVPPCVDVYMC